MALKRYTPKYKILAKLKQAVWLNKRSKIKKFKKQKWESKVKIYFPKKVKIYDQDSSTCIIGKGFDSDRVLRLKKVYKYLLQDKQALQLYYGARRLKLYQLKRFVDFARKVGQRKKLAASKVFFHSMENRLEVGLYRLAFVNSLMQSRKLLSSRYVKVDSCTVKGFGFQLRTGSIVQLDSFKLAEVLSRYLKFNAPFFYFRKKEKRKYFFFQKKRPIFLDFLSKEKISFFNFLRVRLTPRGFEKNVK